MTHRAPKFSAFASRSTPKYSSAFYFAIGVAVGLVQPERRLGRSSITVVASHRPVATTAAPAAASSLSQNIARRADLANRAKQGSLHFKPVDPTHGDIDPTLKLWLLDRVRTVKPIEGGRNLFETGPEIGARERAGRLPKVAKPMLPKPLQPVGTHASRSPPAASTR